MRQLLILLALLGLGAGVFVMAGSAKRVNAESQSEGLTPSAKVAAEDKIRTAMDTQAQAWSGGDIDTFMESYWKSDKLRFASGGSINSGWEVTKARYKKRYPDRGAMGRLAFSDLDVQILSSDDALVFGRWTLTREADTPGGLFTLHWRKIDGQWKIVSDHTSSGD
jgi:ketosteroid isomerase-like protein